MTPGKIVQRLVPLIEERYAVLESALGTQSMQEVYDALDALLSRTPSPEESSGDRAGKSRSETKVGNGAARSRMTV